MYHEHLTAERWKRFPFSTRLLMIGTELKRLQHWLALGDTAEAQQCIDRTHELLDLTIATAPVGRTRRELCRVREVLRGIMTSAAPDHEARVLTRALIGDL